MILHLTNGDIAAGKLKQQFPSDVVLAWRDALHDGPVPPGLSLQQLSEVRARFVAEAGWASYPETSAYFRRRDAIVANALQFRETVLWFEKDLYDLLQLLQILHQFHQNPVPRLSMAPVNDYIGNIPAPALKVLFPQRRPVPPSRIEAGSAAWQAFRDPDPRALEPHLDAWPVLVRLCEEHPWTTDGLSRTERTVARLRAEGITESLELFRASTLEEEFAWRGDASFLRFLNGARDRDPNYLWDPAARRFELRDASTTPTASR